MASSDTQLQCAMHEDYRAGLTIDAGHERFDRAQRRTLTMPVQVLWSSRDDLEDLRGDPLRMWSHWVPGIIGRSIDSGHHMTDEAPDELATSLSVLRPGKRIGVFSFRLPTSRKA